MNKILDTKEVAEVKSKPATKKDNLFSNDEPIVDICSYDGHLYVATSKAIYVVQGREKDRLVPVKLSVQS